jgi:hypothetical protein
MVTRKTRPGTRKATTPDEALENDVLETEIAPVDAREEPTVEGEEQQDVVVDDVVEGSDTDVIAPMEDQPSEEVRSEVDDKDQQPPEIIEPSTERLYDTGYGWVVINGTRYEHDVVVLPDGSVNKRPKKLSKDKRAKYGHTPLTRKELLAVLDGDPKLIIIGTGQSGSMPITPRAMTVLEKRAAFIGPTPEALARLEGARKKTLAMLHVTC